MGAPYIVDAFGDRSKTETYDIHLSAEGRMNQFLRVLKDKELQNIFNILM